MSFELVKEMLERVFKSSKATKMVVIIFSTVLILVNVKLVVSNNIQYIKVNVKSDFFLLHTKSSPEGKVH